MPSSLPDPLSEVGTLTVRPSTAVPGVTHDTDRQCAHMIDGSVFCRYPPLSDSDYCGLHHHGYRKPPTKDLLTFREHMVTAAQYELLRMSPLAGEAIEEVIKDPKTPAHVRVKAATELWDRIGIRGGVDLNVKSEITVNPSEEIARRLDSMREALTAGSDELPPAATDTIQSTAQLTLIPEEDTGD